MFEPEWEEIIVQVDASEVSLRLLSVTTLPDIWIHTENRMTAEIFGCVHTAGLNVQLRFSVQITFFYSPVHITI